MGVVESNLVKTINPKEETTIGLVYLALRKIEV